MRRRLLQLLVCPIQLFVFGLTSSKIAPKSVTYSFSVPLVNPRPKPSSFTDKFIELWNDPRPISSLIQPGDNSFVGVSENEVPYCVISDEFTIDGESFQILLYPCGRFVGSSASTSSGDGAQTYMSGAASAYLRYLPKNYGDEVDITWRLRLSSNASNESDHEDKTYLQISTAGGLPKSNTTWSAGMTFCHEFEAVESVGRATDWGSSIWSAQQVCKAFKDHYVFAEGEISIFAKRSGESSFALPLLSKGGLGAVYRAANQYSANKKRRGFRVGEVIVPRNIPGFESDVKKLQQQFIYPGIDYRVMTMTDRRGNEIFSTEIMDDDGDKSHARLALRPCGWKLQQQLWKGYGMATDWPVEVTVGNLAQVSTTRFNANSAVPRIVSAFQRDWRMYTTALAVAITPIPLALVLRTLISFYAIPSASMEPTLMKGDLMMVEKFPGIYERTHRGDVILFRPPPELVDIVQNNGSQLSSTSLFVKRIVGLPGDENIQLVENNDVLINSQEAVGPDRNLCQDEPLRLIDKFLKNGKGTQISKLNVDEVYVLGDCKAVSVDSRAFGILPKENIVGKPIARIFPINRFRLGPF